MEHIPLENRDLDLLSLAKGRLKGSPTVSYSYSERSRTTKLSSLWQSQAL